MTKSLQIQGSKVLRDITNSQKKIIVLEGGARSTKTWSLFQWIIINCFKQSGELYMIGRLKMTWVKLTLLRDFAQIVEKYNLPIMPEVNINRAEQVYYLNGNTIMFVGMDEPLKLHGVSPDYVWINEAIEASYKDYQQLAIRVKKKIFLDYNPAAETHWIYDNIISDVDCEYFHSTMRDNPWLEYTIVNELNKLEQTDPVAYKIYNLGLRAQQKGLIFKNWETVPRIPEGARVVAYGLDFGYVNDPSACILLAIYEGELYWDELFYERGLVNIPIRNKQGFIERNISDKLVESGLQGRGARADEIIADSAEIKSIQELYAVGWNIKPAHKPPIKTGLDILLRYKHNITDRSINLIKEFRNYKWAVDKDGEPIRPEKPIDDFNHGIDAGRYVAVYKLMQRYQGVTRIN
ncbi:MAG: PBSX family phage terminase large subunit [Dehalococcoidia bacterium]|nr:PBSX family phage terminase large subunit [Dehalococcoidia bacterium]